MAIRPSAAWTNAIALAVAVGCSSETPAPQLSDGESLEPSEVVAPAIDLARLAKTSDCIRCHVDAGAHWEASVHRYASFDNPWYRASIDEFREKRGRQESRFCAGCHDPLLLISGRIDGDVTPTDDLAYAGITCLVCHTTESTRADGNGSYALSDAPVLLPDPADDEEIDRHRAQLTMTPLRSAELCGSCHRSFSGSEIGNEHHLPGIDDLGDWASSAYAGAATWHLASADQATCQTCHMPGEPASPGEMAGVTDGTVRSHRWAASHTALLSQLGDEAAAAQTKAALEGAVVVDVGAVKSGTRRTLFPRESKVRPSERLVFDVLLENRGVGHRFPGGIRDLQDSWVEVVVRDANGRTLASSTRAYGDDDAVFSLRATVLDGEAKPERLHRVDRFSTPAFDRTLEAHDARAVRYSMKLPSRLALPLRVDAELLHRKHPDAFRRLACEASRTERGIAFSEGAEARGKVALDPCLDPPVTTIGSATVWLGQGARSRSREGGAARTDLDRLLTQALALLHGRQERVDLAKPSIDRAVRIASGGSDTTQLARALVLRARLATSRGRSEDAVRSIQRAELLIGANPVLDRVRGDAFARVWRWRESADAFERVVNVSPNDPTAWRALARAYGSLGLDTKALAAAERGLTLLPNDESLLRTRALSLRALGDPRAAEAEASWLGRRAPDVQPARLSRCEQTHEVCRRDRQPIPHYTLVPRTKRFHASADSR